MELNWMYWMHFVSDFPYVSFGIFILLVAIAHKVWYFKDED